MNSVVSWHLPVYWLCWGVSLCVCAWALWRTIGRRNEPLGLPLLASGIWCYFYVYLSITAAFHLTSYLSPDAFALGQATALGCLICVIAGWSWGKQRSTLRWMQRSPMRTWRNPAGHATDKPAAIIPVQRALPVLPKPRQLYWVGLGLMLLGTVAHHAFLGQDRIDWRNTSAYWYLMFHITYPGAALAVAALCVLPKSSRWWRVSLFVALVLYAMAPHVLRARRGPLLPMLIVLLYTPALLQRWRIRTSVLVVCLGLCGFVMLFFVPARNYLYEGRDRLYGGTKGAWEAAMKNIDPVDVLTRRTRSIDDNEFVYHCAAVTTIYRLDLYQYGSGYASLLTHWIPRSWWPTKPKLGQGAFPAAYDRIPAVWGWGIAVGGSWAGVASSFEQLGFLCGCFWFVYGWGAARLYSDGLFSGNVQRIFAYVGLLAASHWLISQSLFEAFVPLCIYQLVFWVSLKMIAAPSARSRRAIAWSEAGRPRRVPPYRSMVPGGGRG